MVPMYTIQYKIEVDDGVFEHLCAKKGRMEMTHPLLGRLAKCIGL